MMTISNDFEICHLEPLRMIFGVTQTARNNTVTATEVEICWLSLNLIDKVGENSTSLSETDVQYSRSPSLERFKHYDLEIGCRPNSWTKSKENTAINS